MAARQKTRNNGQKDIEKKRKEAARSNEKQLLERFGGILSGKDGPRIGDYGLHNMDILKRTINGKHQA